MTSRCASRSRSNLWDVRWSNRSYGDNCRVHQTFISSYATNSPAPSATCAYFRNSRKYADTISLAALMYATYYRQCKGLWCRT